jgi:hypothetical protein
LNAAYLSILGLILGATLQYFFTRHIENQRHIRDLRSKAYMDLLKSISECANFRPKYSTKEGMDLAERTANAKARICLFGSTRVIQAYSLWEKLGPNMETEERRAAFIEMVKAMRTDSGGEIELKSEDLQNVLLGVH